MLIMYLYFTFILFVGAIDKNLELPLDAAELANQASKLLEEHDFTEVLNKIPDDAFNDLFVGECLSVDLLIYFFNHFLSVLRFTGNISLVAEESNK